MPYVLHLPRPRLRMFSDVNRPGTPGYRDGWVRHHNVPTQARHDSDVGPMVRLLEHHGCLLDNFETNGSLLPTTLDMVRRHGLPLHRGGHRKYNQSVLHYLRATRVLSERVKNDRIRIMYARMCLHHCQTAIRALIAEQGAESVDDIIFPTDFAPIDAHRMAEYLR